MLTFAQDRSREDLDRDPMLRRALLNCVQVIGEAAARTSMDGQRRAPQLPWPKMIGMRHILVHAYFDIDLDAVWRVVQDHLPSLVEDLQAVLAGWR